MTECHVSLEKYGYHLRQVKNTLMQTERIYSESSPKVQDSIVHALSKVLYLCSTDDGFSKSVHNLIRSKKNYGIKQVWKYGRLENRCVEAYDIIEFLEILLPAALETIGIEIPEKGANYNLQLGLIFPEYPVFLLKSIARYNLMQYTATQVFNINEGEKPEKMKPKEKRKLKNDIMKMLDRYESFIKNNGKTSCFICNELQKHENKNQ